MLGLGFLASLATIWVIHNHGKFIIVAAFYAFIRECGSVLYLGMAMETTSTRECYTIAKYTYTAGCIMSYQ